MAVKSGDAFVQLDKENELISGEFSFVAYDEDNDSNINVTDGVFTEVEWQVVLIAFNEFDVFLKAFPFGSFQGRSLKYLIKSFFCHFSPC